MAIFITNFAGKTFADQKLSAFLWEKTFANGKIREKTLQIRLLTRKNTLFFHNILSYTIYFYISSPSRPFSLLCMPWRIKKAILEIFLGRKKLSRIEFFLEFRGKKLSRFTDLKISKGINFREKGQKSRKFLPAKVSALKIAIQMF